MSPDTKTNRHRAKKEHRDAYHNTTALDICTFVHFHSSFLFWFTLDANVPKQTPTPHTLQARAEIGTRSQPQQRRHLYSFRESPRNRGLFLTGGINQPNALQRCNQTSTCYATTSTTHHVQHRPKWKQCIPPRTAPNTQHRSNSPQHTPASPSYPR